MKKNRNIQKISPFNCQGLLSSTNNDYLHMIWRSTKQQETHMKGYGVHNLQSSNGNNYLLYYSGHKIKSIINGLE